MKALLEMLGPHADADARPDFVAGDRCSQKFPAAQAFFELRHRDQRGQYDRADMQHSLTMHVVELEALHLRAVHERRVRRR